MSAAAGMPEILDALEQETESLLERAYAVFLEYDFLEHAILDGRLTGGHVVTALARAADGMADELLAGTARPVPPVDRGRRWDIGEGGELRPGAVLLDDLVESSERLADVLARVLDWSALPPDLRLIPARRLLQLVVHHADLGRPWEELPDAVATVAATQLTAVLGDELAGMDLEIDAAAEGLRITRDGMSTRVAGPAFLIIAWASGRADDLGGIPADAPRPAPRELV